MERMAGNAVVSLRQTLDEKAAIMRRSKKERMETISDGAILGLLFYTLFEIYTLVF
jgi:hypothetical protein